MALSAGTRLGPYEIVSPLGAGGTARSTGRVMTPDGKSCVFSNRRTLDELFLLEGLRLK